MVGHMLYISANGSCHKLNLSGEILVPLTDLTETWDYDYDTLNRLEEAKSPDGAVPGWGLQPLEHPKSLKALKF